MQHHANPNLLCNGQSPLSLAIASGNDRAIDELLAYGADPNLPLTHGVGSALCQAASTEHEGRRTPQARLQLASLFFFTHGVPVILDSLFMSFYFIIVSCQNKLLNTLI